MFSCDCKVKITDLRDHLSNDHLLPLPVTLGDRDFESHYSVEETNATGGGRSEMARGSFQPRIFTKFGRNWYLQACSKLCLLYPNILIRYNFQVILNPDGKQYEVFVQGEGREEFCNGFSVA